MAPAPMIRCAAPAAVDCCPPIGAPSAMDLFVFLAVLAAAAFHAGWNALLKLNVEPIVATSLVAAASGAVAVPFAIFVGHAQRRRLALRPGLGGDPHRLLPGAGAGLQARRPGPGLSDRARLRPADDGGASPRSGSARRSGRTPGPASSCWPPASCCSRMRGGRALQRFDVRSVGFALLTSLTITTYTLVDGIGARLSGSALQYTVWLFLLSGGAMALYGFVRLGKRLAGDFVANWQLTLGGAALSTAAYGIAIWAMTVAPIALVAACARRACCSPRCSAWRCCASPCCPPASPPPASCWPASCWCGCGSGPLSILRLSRPVRVRQAPARSIRWRSGWLRPARPPSWPWRGTACPAARPCCASRRRTTCRAAAGGAAGWSTAARGDALEEHAWSAASGGTPARWRPPSPRNGRGA